MTNPNTDQPDLIECRIPFAGFYETTHSHEIDDHMEMSRGENWYDQDYGTEYKDLELEYCEGYTAAFAEAVGVALTFKEMTSPREYNFTTDRIFCTVSAADVERLKAELDLEAMAALVKDHFTSYDGFLSFYSNSYDEWLNQAEPFDHNQICALLECTANQRDPEWEMWIREDIYLN